MTWTKTKRLTCWWTRWNGGRSLEPTVDPSFEMYGCYQDCDCSISYFRYQPWEHQLTNCLQRCVVPALQRQRWQTFVYFQSQKYSERHLQRRRHAEGAGLLVWSHGETDQRGQNYHLFWDDGCRDQQFRLGVCAKFNSIIQRLLSRVYQLYYRFWNVLDLKRLVNFRQVLIRTRVLIPSLCL